MNRSRENGAAESRDEGTIRLPHPLKEKIKDGIVAVSLANMCFVTAWFNSLYDKDSYFNKLPISTPTLLALLTNILWLSVFVWLVIRMTRRLKNRVLHLILDLWFVGMLLIPANFVRAEIFSILDYQVMVFFKQPVVILCTLVVMALVLWKHVWAAWVVRGIAAILSPLAVFTVGKMILLLLGVIHLHQQVSEPRLPPVVAVHAGQPRVLWIIFDAADYRLIYEQRPAGVQMPEFDRLRNESLCAENAYSPANNTLTSLPALISGRQLSWVASTHAELSDLDVTLADTGAKTTWKKLPSVFAGAQALGVNTALVGWYHPYARVLGSGLNYCVWYPFPLFEPDRAPDFGSSLRMQIGCTFLTPHVRHIFLSVCQDSLRQSLSLATNGTYGLIFLHLPPPHTPGIYLPAEHRFTFWPMSRAAGYLNNLALVDLELGQIRHAMEASGEWDKTWLIISADHSWQESSLFDGKIDYRVPFVIKPPGVSDGTDYTPKINTVVTHDLVLAILRGDLTGQTNLVPWLDVHGKPLPTILRQNAN